MIRATSLLGLLTQVVKKCDICISKLLIKAQNAPATTSHPSVFELPILRFLSCLFYPHVSGSQFVEQEM